MDEINDKVCTFDPQGFKERLDQVIKLKAQGNKTKFCKHINLKLSTLNSWMNKETFKSPTIDTVFKVCEGYEVSFEWLLAGYGNMQLYRSTGFSSEPWFKVAWDRLGLKFMQVEHSSKVFTEISKMLMFDKVEQAIGERDQPEENEQVRGMKLKIWTKVDSWLELADTYFDLLKNTNVKRIQEELGQGIEQSWQGNDASDWLEFRNAKTEMDAHEKAIHFQLQLFLPPVPQDEEEE